MGDEMVVKGSGQGLAHRVSPFPLTDIMLIHQRVVTGGESRFIVKVIPLIEHLVVVQLAGISLKRHAHLPNVEAEVVIGHNIKHTFNNARCVKTELMHQSHGLSRLAKPVVHADADHPDGMVFGQELGDGTAQSTCGLMFFDRKDQTGIFGSFVKDLPIQWLNGVHVDHPCGDAHMIKHVGRLERLPHLMACSHQGNVFALTHQLRLPDLEVLVLSGEVRHRLAAETDIDGTVKLEYRLFRGDLGLCGVAGRDHGHVGQHTHRCNVFQSLMCSAIRTHRNARMSAADDHMNVVVTGRDPDLVVGTMGRKHAIGAEYGDLAAQGQARGHSHGILFSDAHREKTIRECIPEEVHPHRGSDIRSQTHHTAVFLCRCKHAFAESGFCSFISFICIFHSFPILTRFASLRAYAVQFPTLSSQLSTLSSQLLQELRQLFLRRHLAVPLVVVLYAFDAFAHHGIRDDDGWFSYCLVRHLQRHLDLAIVMAVDLDSLPAKGNPFVFQWVDTHHLFRTAVDLQTVAVDDGAEVVRLVVCCCHGRLPDASLLLLAVAHNAENAVGHAIQLGGEGHTQSDA